MPIVSLRPRHRPRSRAVSCALLSALVLGGCFERSLGSLAPCTRAEVGDVVDLTVLENVDLLFVIDDSGSMAEEQSELIRQIPRLVEVLASGDRGLDGTMDFRPARSIHVGIVSTDMGVADATDVVTCDRAGDDGVLQVAGARCTGAARGPVFDFERGADAAAFAADVGCAADLGTSGCGEEQPLESMLKALSPSAPTVWTIPGYAPPTFLTGTGHGGDADANAGLVRDDSVLAIILISDENDSSTLDPALFSDAPAYTDTNINLRGLAHPEALAPVERYVAGLLALRTVPRHLVFGAIVGVPPEASALDYDAMLALPAMQERVDPVRPDRLIASCRGPLQTEGAYPGRRAIELARGLAAAGAGASISSICASSFEPALDGIIGLVSEAFRGTCLPRALDVGADGRVSCEVRQALAPIGTAPDERTHCEALGDRTVYEHVADETVVQSGQTREREVCRIHQLSRDELSGTGAGWFYEDGRSNTEVATDCPASGATTSQRISIRGVTLVNGAELRLVCHEAVRGRGGEVSLGTGCDPSATTDVCASALAPDRVTPLACDAFTRTCVVPCDPELIGDAACTSAGVPGYQCDDRAAEEYFGGMVPDGIDPAATHRACVNATCE